jgi:hypothetical protein
MITIHFHEEKLISMTSADATLSDDGINRLSFFRVRSIVGRMRMQVFICFLLGLAGSIPMHAVDQFDVINKQVDTSSQTVWRITQPNVKQAVTSYPQIKFLPGDSVSITAAGCVQTGGHGSTWKRYVNPSGPNSDHLYHGKIWVPGINNGLIRIKDFAAFNVARQIPSPLPAGLNPNDLFLRLGYEDDGYGDNGYYSHDDGTENQCKNSVNAYVVISVGHNGTIAANPSSFTGIAPAQYRCQAAWSFGNFNTPQLSKQSFNDAFNLSWYDYIDPATEITFLAGRGIASSGNCEGMSLLANVGEDQFVVGQLDESFWANYKSQNPATYDINVSHWKQLSATFLRGYIGTVFQSPSTTAGQIERDLTKANYNYGLLSLEHGSGGHVLVPLRVNHVGAQLQIEVYDPNRPCGRIPDTANYPPVIVQGNNWSYVMADGTTWSGSNDLVGFSGFGYVPYLGQDGWSDLGTNLLGMVKVIFGNDVNVEQVTDATGKRLYVPGRPNVLDKSTQGLSNQLIRVPFLAQNQYGRPRNRGPAFKLNNALNLTPAMQAQIQKLQSEYEADYGGSGQIFLAPAKQLSSLTFTVSGKSSSRPVRMLVGQSGQFYEIKSNAQSGGHPTLVIHNLAQLEDGISVQSRDQAPLKVAVTHGLVSAQNGNITLQRTDEMPVGNTAVRFSLARDKTLQFSGLSPAGPIPVHSQVIDRNAGITAVPDRILKEAKPN